MITIDKNLIAVWFVPLPSGAGFDNWLGALSRVDGRPLFKHRFRYCDPLEPGADPHEGLDTKRQHVGVFNCTVAEAVANVRQAARTLAKEAGTEVTELAMNPERDVRRFADELLAQPWAQARHEPA